MEWMPDVWEVFLASNFGFSSDVLTSPALQPKLRFLIPWGKQAVCPEAQGAWQMQKQLTFKAHLLQEALCALS